MKQVKDLTPEQLKKLFCAAVTFNNEYHKSLIAIVEQHYGEITIRWDVIENSERWVIYNSIAEIELTESLKFRCGTKFGDFHGALLFDIVAAYKCLEEFELITT